MYLDHELERIKDRLSRVGLEPAEWCAASYVSGVTRWLTAAELTEIKDQPTMGRTPRLPCAQHGA